MNNPVCGPDGCCCESICSNKKSGSTVVRMEFGSHLYGTNTETSDRDYKSVHIPDIKQILLQRVKDSTGKQAKRVEGEKNSPNDVDDESYSLQRYLHLLAEGQTVAIDMLFAPTLQTSELWEDIQKNKDRLLTKKSAAFVGYCRTQANKYGIKGSRVAAVKAAMEYFKIIYEKNPTYKVGDCLFLPVGDHARFVTKETTTGKFEEYYECCNKMVGFKNTVKEAYNMFSKIYDEYGKRARQAEIEEGIDWKALSHAVRVGTEALELLANCKITFPLENRTHLLEIKKGSIPYKFVAEEIENLLVEVEQASAKSTMREEPDHEFIDNIVLQIYGREVYNNYIDILLGAF